ncbi:hypothetical protein [Paludifilum halophilum]|uniref:TIGR04086 family membrane protein n=1 Tax=Paludifilum halophilum TaxID=1642702 RepID=A0A235B3E5_9BACL|nr:hypothetical protein [Paludifilum halophilum]OYD06145.1 hypothetical protein CHM34_17985 [Paludifilum halophilum]
MIIKILQGLGVGTVLSLTLGYLSGLLGMESPLLVTILLLLGTYLGGGLVAGVGSSHPFLTAGLCGVILTVINQGFTILFMASPSTYHPVGILFGLFVGLVISLIGGFLGSIIKKG